MEPLFSLIGMPIFGYIVDRYARRSLFMMFGSVLILPTFLMLAYTDIPPVIPMAMMGVAFALVPAVMWPALPTSLSRSRLGLANGMLDTIQQIGLVLLNLLSWRDERHWVASATNPAATGRHAGYSPRSACSPSGSRSGCARWKRGRTLAVWSPPRWRGDRIRRWRPVLRPSSSG